MFSFIPGYHTKPESSLVKLLCREFFTRYFGLLETRKDWRERKILKNVNSAPGPFFFIKRDGQVREGITGPLRPALVNRIQCQCYKIQHCHAAKLMSQYLEHIFLGGIFLFNLGFIFSNPTAY